MKINGLLVTLLYFQSIAFVSLGLENNNSVDLKLIADSLNKNAEISLAYDLEHSKNLAEEALKLSKQINYSIGQVSALKTLSAYCFYKEDYIATLEFYFKLIEESERSSNIESLVWVYISLTHFFILTKDFELAEKYHLILTRIAQKSIDPSLHVPAFWNHAAYCLARGDYDLAIRYLYLCFPYFHKAQGLSREGSVYKSLGDAFLQKKRYTNAEYYYRLAIAIYSRNQDLTELAIIYTRIAHIYQLLNNVKQSLEFNLSALRFREQTGNTRLIASSCLNVGESYRLLGRKDSARFYIYRSLHLAKNINNSILLEAIYETLCRFAKKENRYADALEYFKAKSEYRTKINQDRTRWEILILDANRTIRAREEQNDIIKQEIVIQDLRIKNRRIKLFLYEVAFLTMLSVIFFIEAIARKNRKRKYELTELNTRLSQEIKDRIEAEVRLNRSEELQRFLAENTVDVISLLDANLRRLYISPSSEQFYGYSTREILQMKSPLDLIDQSYHTLVNQHLLELGSSKKSTQFIYKARRKDGSAFWAEANINPVLDTETSEVQNVIKVVRDISERMKHQEELAENSRQKEFLLHEIHNRVKNNFAILVSLMNMQHDQSVNPDLNRSLNDLQLRVRTMSLVHEQLYLTQEIHTIPFGNYLLHLAQIISSSFSNNHVQLKTEIQTCNVPIEMALPLGLIINELITNAYKYAFPDERTGTIWVKLLPEDEEKFCITICDDGVGLAKDFPMNKSDTMGSQIVRILVEQIEAIFEVSNNGGACYRIVFSTTQAE
ncbi:MAG: histidine kinase dimerization/phosphoacceptor domain -containing protein [Bacteroidales bacterium]|nr:histidine kinase dimerization/phosphoacceptor domain -containing protein [Bacteroidales bacterium]